MEHKRILICDDDPGILEMLKVVLEDEGFQVLHEENSLNILEMAKRYSPDVLLLDLWMPVLSGDLVLKSLKEDPHTKNLSVIVFSASTAGREIALLSGASAFITKPFDLDDLLVSINKSIMNNSL